MSQKEKPGPSDTIRVMDLEKHYGSVVALRGVSFEIGHGEIVGFLGPNGAGKSTTLKILTGYLEPTRGGAWILGESVRQTGRSPRSRIGYLPEQAPLYDEMNVTEYLRFVAKMRGIPRQARAEAMDRALDTCGLTDVRRAPIGILSKGFRQRVGLAQAIVHNPEVLILDEPTSGLDPNQVDEMRALIQSFGEEKTVLFSSHILGEVQAIASRVLILNEGRLVADDSPDSLGRQMAGDQIYLLVDRASASACASWLADQDMIRSHQVQSDEEEGAFLVDLAPGYAVSDLAKDVVEHGWPLLELHPDRANLDTVFRRLTQGDA